MGEGQGIEAAVRDVLATDLGLLAALHDRELDAERLAELAAVPAAEWFGLDLESPAAADGLRLVDAGLGALGTPPAAGAVDALAVDYADIYLNHTFRASPNESVWLDKDHLVRQEPMFEIRKWYAHYGLGAEDWSCRTEDHLALQLAFLAHLFATDLEHGPADAARFMDEHPLNWVPDFAIRVAERCRTPFYGGLALVTAAYLDELRDLLAEALGLPRPEPLAPEEAEASEAEEGEGGTAYFPGIGPSW